MSFVFGSNSASTGYNLTRSLRFRSSATAYLNRTPSVAGNRQKFTISVWYKAGGISAGFVNANILNAGGDGSSVLISGTGAFGGTYQDRLLYREGGTTLLYWPMVFRDPASWYHIVFAMDTTQATAANRTKLYVNGVDQGAFSGTAITQNASTSINNTSAHYINTFNGTFYPSDLYYTEYNFIDGQALTPSSFGSTNALTGVWQPAAYTGTYGTNGFYLPFTDNSALTTSSNVGLGKDFSGNANYWVTNNISITAGVTYDSMTDVPTLTSATAANFAVLNPLNSGGRPQDVTDGNLKVTFTQSTSGVTGTIGAPSGKFYWETTIAQIGTSCGIGIVNDTGAGQLLSGSGYGQGANSWVYREDGNKRTNSSSSAYGASYTTGDVIGVAFDATSGSITFYKNGTSQGVAFSGLTLTTYYPVFGATIAVSNIQNVNFGQRPFTYTAPTGFVALNTYNLPTSTILKSNTVMDATLWAGNSSTQSIVNAAAFRPDFVWIKIRSAVGSHRLLDSVRGATNALASNLTQAEFVDSTGLTAFNSNGFTLGADGSYNGSGSTYVGWQWQAGQGTTSSNTNGSITSTVSVNASAGFSVVTFTTTAGVKTVGHSLGVAPALIIVKPRAVVADWYVYGSNYSNTQYLKLNTTDALITDANLWNSTTATSSVFTLGSSWGSGNALVAYCWTPIAGFSAFGSYTGNGSTDGSFVYTGFRPKFVLIKASGLDESWYIYDSTRNTYNVVDLELNPNNSGAEATFTTLDFLSNGFKLRTTNSAFNSSGATYIYACFSENPFKNALAR